MATKKTESQKAVLAREADGTIQLNLTIPQTEVKKTEQEVLTELAKTVEIPGFRKGYAPVDQVKDQVSAQTVLEKILSRILPATFQRAVEEYGIYPILTPKFELIKAGDGDWQVRAITCEAPVIEVGDYKKELEGAKRSSSLWTPGKGAPKDDATPSAPEKENLVIETLIKSSKVIIPKPLIDEEVNHRLSDLVEQTQKLGLTVEQYLASTGKTAEGIREEYAKQAEEQIKVMLILSRVAEQENLEAAETDIEKAFGEQPKNTITSSQREVVKAILKRRAALDKLVSLL